MMQPTEWEGDSHAKMSQCRKGGICKGPVAGKNSMCSRNSKKTSLEEGGGVGIWQWHGEGGGPPEVGGRTGQGPENGGRGAPDSYSKWKGRPCITLSKGGTYLIPILKHSL